jgi:outer membrane protein assembly factor BamB
MAVCACLIACAWLTDSQTQAARPAVGWRHDGTGRFPDADPPTKWSATENVRWKTALPGRGYGSPVVVGERIYVASEPAELLCLNAEDGKILWQTTASLVELLGPAKSEEILAQHRQLLQKDKTIRNALRKAPKDSEEAEKLKKESRALRERIKEFERKYPISGGRAGNAAATPVTDGNTVYVAFGSGIVAAVSRDGKPLWMKFIEGSPLGFGHSSSPLLVDGKLIVHYQELKALDPKTGRVLWSADVKPRYATPVPVHVGGIAAVITPAGQVVRAGDGETLAQTNVNTSEATPVVNEGVLYVHQKGKVMGLRLPEDAGKLSFDSLWQVSSSRGRRTPSSVYDDGLLYGVTTDGILEVVDAKTGKTVYRKRLELRQVYSSVTLAGGNVYVTATDGTTVVLRTGREYVELARNKLEQCGSCPVFVGRRLYLRTRGHLVCAEQ